MANYKPVQNMSNLYDKFYAKFAPSYTPQSASTLKDTLSRAMRPAYDKQITQRRDTGRVNRGEIIAEAGGRGMGTSSAVTDRLLRAKDAEAKDIAGIESDYNAALYSNLLNRLNAQDELSLQAENAARNTALGLAQSMYGKVFGNHGSGGGGWGRRGSTSGDDDDDTFDPPVGDPNAKIWIDNNETFERSTPRSVIKDRQIEDRTPQSLRARKKPVGSSTRVAQVK